MPTLPSVLGFLFGVAVVVLGLATGSPIVGWIGIGIFVGWLVFAIRDRYAKKRRSLS
jgi:hypothetical protein